MFKRKSKRDEIIPIIGDYENYELDINDIVCFSTDGIFWKYVDENNVANRFVSRVIHVQPYNLLVGLK